MPRKSDSKERMIAAARRLFREHGYLGTALSDVVTESAAPRGSMYFHFPGGKEELAGEVTLLHVGDHIAHINRAAAATSTAVQLIEAFIGRIRDELIASNYREGCAMAPIVVESMPASDQLNDATRRGFEDMIATLAARLAEKNVPHYSRHPVGHHSRGPAWKERSSSAACCGAPSRLTWPSPSWPQPPKPRPTTPSHDTQKDAAS